MNEIRAQGINVKTEVLALQLVPAPLYPQILHGLVWECLCHDRPTICYSMATLETGQINVGKTDVLHWDCGNPWTSVTGIPFKS